ncbi:MAG: MBL fold metallo-hydrolase, partial [Victivallales bacterium]
INTGILIDCGVTGIANLSRFGISPDTLTDLIITHSHRDHFVPAVIAEIIASRTTETPLNIRAAPEAIALLSEKFAGKFTPYSLLPGDRFTIGNLNFTALPANHQVENSTEQALNYLIETPYGNILYALDGAWMLKKARMLIGDKKLRMIFWDATMAEPGNWRIFEHNDPAMISLMMTALEKEGTVNGETIVVLDHLARTLWPENPETAAVHNWLLAFDGMELELK